MKEKRYTKRVMAIYMLIALFVFVAVGIVTVSMAAVKADNKIHTATFDVEKDKADGKAVYALMESGSYWSMDAAMGIQYNGRICNPTEYTIADWEISIPAPTQSNINSWWNGEWSTANKGYYVFTPDEMNDRVSPYSENSFGLVLYSNIYQSIPRVTLTYKCIKPVYMYTSFKFLVVLELVDVMFCFALVASGWYLRRYIKRHTAYKALVNESLRTIANIIDTKDEYTRGHSIRVAIYTRMLARCMGLPDYDQERLYYIALLHDIGKIGIPSEILTKPGKLSDEEFDIIKTHPAVGANIMRDFESIKGLQDGVRCHHEKYNGRGYNQGLRGKEIPLEGRIICVADSYDAMASKRCYRNSLSYEYILSELRRNSGEQFDPEIVEHMIKLVEDGCVPITDSELEGYSIEVNIWKEGGYEKKRFVEKTAAL